jgi:hypothetical protein
LKTDKNGKITADRCLKNNVIPPQLFNMEITCLETSCGTVGCIGGWMQLKMDNDFSNIPHTYALQDLFYNFDGVGLITREMAVKVIDRVLKGKYEDPWSIYRPKC